MKASSILQTLASLAIIAVFLCGQQSPAQNNHHSHFKKTIVSGPKSENDLVREQGQSVPNLYSLQAAFVGAYPIISANSDGSDLMPCLDFYQGGAGSNPNCPTLGSPSVPFPVNAIVLGFPAHSWPLKNSANPGNGFGCDALTNGTTGPTGSAYNPCGQADTWYEDDTNDSTDDLLQRVVVRQGARIIYDSGIVDFGPAGPSVTYPAQVLLSYDANFGFWPGAGSIGPNNGNCSASAGYPLTAPANPGEVYELESGETCEQPVSGEATFSTFTALGTPEYTRVTGRECTSQEVASPCYTVKWDKKYEIHQDWKIFLK